MSQRGNSPPPAETAWRALLKGDLVSEMRLPPGGRKSIPESENWLVMTSPSERSEKEMIVVMSGLIDVRWCFRIGKSPGLITEGRGVLIESGAGLRGTVRHSLHLCQDIFPSIQYNSSWLSVAELPC